MSRETMEWTKRLYAKEPWKRWVVLGAAAAAALLGFALLGHILFPIVALLAVLGSTMEYWAPLRYVLTEKSASVRCGISVTAIEWSDIKRIVASDDGLKLSPLAKEGRTSPFRGVYLRFEGNADAVREFVLERAPKDARIVEYGANGGGDGESIALGSGEDSLQEAGDSGDSVRGDA